MIKPIMKALNIALIGGIYVLSLGEPVAAAEGHPLPTLPYTYPFDDAMMAQNLGTKPIVVELFTSLDCAFCMRAEQMFADMAQKSRAILLACHTDPEGPDYPLAREFCTARQERYGATLSDGLLYTPQMVINGHIDVVGYEFDDVRLGLTQGFDDAPLPVSIRPSTQSDLVVITLPTLPLPKGQTADVFMIDVRPPTMVPKTMRQSATRPNPLVQVATRFTPLGGFNGTTKTITVPFTPSEDTQGFVILVQRSDNHIIAATEWPPRPNKP